MDLKLDAAAIEALIRGGLPSAEAMGVSVEAVGPGWARIRYPFDTSMLRPGNVISGPTLMAAADTAMYACVLAHLGAELMAVTTDMTMHFLSKTPRGDVIATARILKLGRRLVVLDCAVGGADGRETCHVTGTYAVPCAVPSAR